MSAAYDTDVNNFEIVAVTFAALGTLYGMSVSHSSIVRLLPLAVFLITLFEGVYFVLFSLALYSTYVKSGVSYKNLRLITVVLYVRSCVPK